MVEISIDIEPHFGLTWNQWKRIVPEVERLGFAGLYCSDHFTVYPQPPDEDSLELIVALTYLAASSSRLHFGSLVAPFSFRDPVMLARQAIALDNLSGGRMILGVGAGWSEREHEMFGYNLADTRSRIERFEEGVAVITLLTRSDTPVTYAGNFYTLQKARLLPRPQHARGIKLLLGTRGTKRGLSLVARYADIWNVPFVAPSTFGDLSLTLDSLLNETGRSATDVKRTVMTALLYSSDSTRLERQVRPWRRLLPELAELPLDSVLAVLRRDFGAIVGTPEQVIEQIAAYVTAGAQEIILEWFDPDDLEGLRDFSYRILPHFVN